MKTPKFVNSLRAFIEGRRANRHQKRETAIWDAVRREWTITFVCTKPFLAHNGRPICPLPFESVDELSDFLFDTWSKHLEDFKR